MLVAQSTFEPVLGILSSLFTMVAKILSFHVSAPKWLHYKAFIFLLFKKPEQIHKEFSHMKIVLNVKVV